MKIIYTINGEIKLGFGTRDYVLTSDLDEQQILEFKEELGEYC